MPSTGGRSSWVDAAKGLAIVLVVMHHVVIPLDGARLLPSSVASANYYLATSRMPLLFLVSGLFAGRALDRPWRTVLRRRVAHYAWLYGSWSVITAFVQVLLSIRSLDEVPGALVRWIVEPGPSLWFIYGLALFSVVTKLLQRVPIGVVVPAALVLSVVVEHTRALPELGFAWHRFAVLYVFFLVGARCGPRLRHAVERAPRGAWALAAVVAGIWGTTAAALDLHGLPGVTLLQSVLFVAAILLTCVRLDGLLPSRGAAWLGERTLPVYLVHGLLIAVLMQLAPPAGWQASQVSATAVLVAAVAPLIALSLGLHALLVRAGARWLFEVPGRLASTKAPGST